MSSADAPPLVPSGYTWRRELGLGAYGKVHLCRDQQGRDVAVKAATAPKARRRTRKEGELLSRLIHPNVLKHYATLDENDSVFIVTEYLSGGDLLHFMKARQCRPLPEAVARNLFIQLVAAVDYLHQSGIVHRDIKCENILLSTDYQSIRLADFGFACPWTEKQLLHESLGSLHYASPEMCANLPYRGPEADIWSMGVVLYAMLVGRLPFGGKTEEELSQRIKEGSFHIPSAIGHLPAALLRWLLHPDASSRISMKEIKQHAWLSANLTIELPRSSSEPLPKATPLVLSVSPALSPAPPPTIRRNQGPSSLPSVLAAPEPTNTSRIPRIPATTPIGLPPSVRRTTQHAPSLTSSSETVPPAAASDLMSESQPHGSGLFCRLSRFLGVDGTRKFSFSRIIHKDNSSTSSSQRSPSPSFSRSPPPEPSEEASKGRGEAESQSRSYISRKT